jgi:hypothetical protein
MSRTSNLKYNSRLKYMKITSTHLATEWRPGGKISMHYGKCSTEQLKSLIQSKEICIGRMPIICGLYQRLSNFIPMRVRIVHYIRAEGQMSYSNTNICPTMIISMKYRHTNKSWTDQVLKHLFELMFGIKTWCLKVEKYKYLDTILGQPGNFIPGIIR